MLNEGTPKAADITPCDLEPIHIPGSIQPHGIMLIANDDMVVIGAAGDVEGRLSSDWAGRPLSDLISEECVAMASQAEEGGLTILGRIQGHNDSLNAVAYRTGGKLIV